MSATSEEFDFDDDKLQSAEESEGLPDAIELLQGEHDEVKQMFEDYESMLDERSPDEDREALAREICTALTIHATIEEEILYPAAREVMDSPRTVDNALVEHATARALIEEIEGMRASDPLFDAKVTVLGDHVRHHIEEEEEDLLPQLAESSLDLDDLGAQLAERKDDLMARMADDL
jgi:hemerythrin-like domain-containing protein